MDYPLISEYVEAIKAAGDNFDQLKHLRPVLDDDGQPVMTSGNFAVVFEMKDEKTGKFHAVKCFLREQEGRAEAYRQIAEELEYVFSTFLTPIKYLDKELFVDTSNSEESEFPVLLMDWVEGQTLDKYIREHIDDQYDLSLLAYQFSRLAMWLLPQPFAHGDLKPDNILVKDDGTLVLVDYDGMFVPAMKGQRARELGSPDFRHPGRTEDVFDEHIDDFSLVSILLSLKAIALQPDLLEQYGASDRLLFSEKDYRNLAESRVMDALKTMMQDTELATLYSLFILSSAQNNLSQASFRLLDLSKPHKRPSLRCIKITKPIVNTRKELIPYFQGKENVTHVISPNGTESYLTQIRSFADEAYSKGACKLNTVENDKKHVLFLFNSNDEEVGRYYIGKKLQGKTPTQLTKMKNVLAIFDSWNPETDQWVPCVGIADNTTQKAEKLRTNVIEEETCLAFCSEDSQACEDKEYASWQPHAMIIKKNGKLGVVIDDGTTKKQIIPFVYDTWFDYDGNETEIKEDFFDNYQDYIGYFAIKNTDGTFIIHGYDKDGTLSTSFTCEKFNPDSFQLNGKYFLRCPADGVIYDDIRRMRMDCNWGSDTSYIAFRRGNKWSLKSDDLKKTYIDYYECDGFEHMAWTPKGYYVEIKKGQKVQLCLCRNKSGQQILPYEYDSISWRYYSTPAYEIQDSCFVLQKEDSFAVCSNDLLNISPFIFNKVGAMINDNEVEVTRQVNGKDFEFIYNIVNSKGWRFKEIRPFNPEEIAAVYYADVISTQYGLNARFKIKDMDKFGGYKFIPLSTLSTLLPGDTIDLNTAKLITLCKDGEDDIARVIEQ